MIDPRPNARFITDGRSINASGLAAGWFASRVRLAAVITRHGSVTKILPSAGDCCTAANSINDHGEVVGAETTLIGQVARFRAFRWSSATGLKILDLRTEPEAFSDAIDINIDGQVVGIWRNGSVDTTFYWDAENGMHPIPDLIDPADPLAAVTVILESFVKINASGQIAVSGLVNGASRALLLTPTP